MLKYWSDSKREERMEIETTLSNCLQYLENKNRW